MESIAKTEVEQKLLTLCSGELEPKGYRIVDLDCRIGGKSLLRIFIERLGADSNQSAKVSLEDCVTVSRSLNDLLESFQDIPGTFDLEVSSPGLDRRLRLRSDFEAHRGGEVQLKLVDKIEGLGGQVRGLVLDLDEESIRLENSGREVAVPWKQVKQANLIWKTE